jgi:hypothetical protein
LHYTTNEIYCTRKDNTNGEWGSKGEGGVGRDRGIKDIHLKKKIINLGCHNFVKLNLNGIQRSGFDSQLYHIFCELVGLERGPLSLVSTTEELLDRKVAAPV